MDILKSIEHEQLKNKIPELRVGNTSIKLALFSLYGLTIIEPFTGSVTYSISSLFISVPSTIITFGKPSIYSSVNTKRSWTYSILSLSTQWFNESITVFEGIA